MAGSLQHEAIVGDENSTFALEAVVGLFHGRNIVKPTDDVRRADRFAGLDALAVQFFDKADVAGLMAPPPAAGGGVEGHACQPRSGLAVLFHLISANDALGNLVVFA